VIIEPETVVPFAPGRLPIVLDADERTTRRSTVGQAGCAPWFGGWCRRIHAGPRREFMQNCSGSTSPEGEPSRISSLTARPRHEASRALSLKDPEGRPPRAHSAARAGETLTTAVVVALRERLARLCGRAKRRRLRDQLREIAQRCAQLPTLDDRATDKILHDDDRGLPR
jgi:antitoxin VapB